MCATHVQRNYTFKSRRIALWVYQFNRIDYYCNLNRIGGDRVHLSCGDLTWARARASRTNMFHFHLKPFFSFRRNCFFFFYLAPAHHSIFEGKFAYVWAVVSTERQCPMIKCHIDRSEESRRWSKPIIKLISRARDGDENVFISFSFLFICLLLLFELGVF